jgi:glycosyltransferase involved in cell wall biosynthesis
LPRHVRGGLVSLCNLAPVTVARQIACIHDLNTRLAPESYGRLFRLAHRAILPALGRRAAAITTVSAFSRSQLARFGIAPEQAITVAPNGADHTARWHRRAMKPTQPGTRPFVLGLGQRQAYKNMAMLAHLCGPLDALGLDLQVVGEVDRAIFAAAGEDMPANLRLLGRVDDERLGELFARALCFVFPSRLEGFGLPAIEAMACGCPVVAADASALPEVCGDAALLVAPDDTPAWVDAIRRLRDQPALRARLAEKGLERSASYTWRRTAEIYLELMARIDGFIAAPQRPAERQRAHALAQ